MRSQLDHLNFLTPLCQSPHAVSTTKSVEHDRDFSWPFCSFRTARHIPHGTPHSARHATFRMPHSARMPLPNLWQASGPRCWDLFHTKASSSVFTTCSSSMAASSTRITRVALTLTLRVARSPARRQIWRCTQTTLYVLRLTLPRLQCTRTIWLAHSLIHLMLVNTPSSF
jgi:hypothetical protein